MTGAGVAYDVDTRLRPSGQQGMLVASFEGYERYQIGEAATWEHLAMLRARPIAGATVRGGRAPARGARARAAAPRAAPWTELAELRQRVIDERARGDDGAAAFKTGAGGLMDVDFLAGGGLLERGARAFPELPSVRAMLAAAGSTRAGAALLARLSAAAPGRGVRALGGGPRRSSSCPAEPRDRGRAGRARLSVRRRCATRSRPRARRIRAVYERVVARGSIAALGA